MQPIERIRTERVCHPQISETKQSQFRYLETPVPQQHSTSALSALSSQAQQNIAALPSAASSLLSSYAGAPKRVEEAQRVSEEREGPDPRDVDRVLGEMVALSGRWALYRRFVSNRLTVSWIWVMRRRTCSSCWLPPQDEEDLEPHANGQDTGLHLRNVASHLAIVDSSDGQRAIENMLRRYYEPMEEWYLRSSIEKVSPREF
jgi:conserved oligomeric Golgi complex subunit 4